MDETEKEEEEEEMKECDDENDYEPVISKNLHKKINKQNRKKLSKANRRKKQMLNGREQTKIYANLINPNKYPKQRLIKSHQFNLTPRAGRN